MSAHTPPPEPPKERRMTEPHKVSRDLTAINELAVMLHDQALHKANDKLMPGGEAMVALAPVGNAEAWEHRYETAERLGLDTSYIQDNLENEAPPLQRIRYWSDRYRTALGADYDLIPTIASETNFLRFHLDWIGMNEPMWEHFADEMKTTRTRLETLLYAGRRTEVGVPCLTCNVDLIRPTWDPIRVLECAGHNGVCHFPHDHCPHDRGGLRDEWKCPNCHRVYDEETYRRAVAQQAYLNAEWLPLDQACDRTGARPGTVRVWAYRDKVRRRKDENTGRMTYNVHDITTHMGDPKEAA